MVPALLAVSVVAVSLVVGRLAKLDARELALQTAGMGAAALIFYGLVLLVA